MAPLWPHERRPNHITKALYGQEMTFEELLEDAVAMYRERDRYYEKTPAEQARLDVDHEKLFAERQQQPWFGVHDWDQARFEEEFRQEYLRNERAAQRAEAESVRRDHGLSPPSTPPPALDNDNNQSNIAQDDNSSDNTEGPNTPPDLHPQTPNNNVLEDVTRPAQAGRRPANQFHDTDTQLGYFILYGDSLENYEDVEQAEQQLDKLKEIWRDKFMMEFGITTNSTQEGRRQRPRNSGRREKNRARVNTRSLRSPPDGLIALGGDGRSVVKQVRSSRSDKRTSNHTKEANIKRLGKVAGNNRIVKQTPGRAKKRI